MSNKSDSGSEDTPVVSNGSFSGAGSQGRGSSMETYEDDVCRDYMRNVCTRGRRCRYRHPPLEERPEQPPPRRDLTFCHDYQNNGCSRPSCKFLHCSRDEQEYFHRTGLLPSRLNNSGRGVLAITQGQVLRAEVPVCRDYLNGECKRGSKCKYRHEAENSPVHYSSNNRRHHSGYDRRDYLSGPDHKRRRKDDDYGADGDRSGSDYAELEDENAMLRRKVSELKKQVSDLTAINEVLLEQNARYRMGKAAVAVAAAAGGVGTIQVTAAASQQGIMPAVALAPAVTPAAHVAAAHSSLTQQLNSSLTQQVALNSDLATQHALAAQRLASLAAQPRMAPSAMSVTPTVTIAQNVAPGPLALTQSNMAAVSMATMPQLHVAHSLTQNLGAPSTSLVSYPIMSQNMRSAVEPSSHAH
ncbi:zinc finger CCCH domain-containing protein 10 [Elysia marginata]|uniref:Zinc finger CCCH domain-containing protein 10 n=1 Tax=Elysia marginata TaxID=1093978 RepID=A0AAV4IVS4_9GAST|nr:zinc finger CCCH domain-containing protein 10 [Elysia marginata]